jgi:membrane protein DedA with SNARE-associated domain
MGHLHYLASLLNQLSYTGVFLLSFFGGYIIPVPEEVILLAIGYLGHRGAFNVFLAAPLSFSAIFASDCVLYMLASANSSRIQKLKTAIEGRKGKFISQEHAGRTIFLLRFVAGLRFLGPLFAGINKVKWQVFALFDLVALAVYLPIVVFFGFYFNNSFLVLVSLIDAVRQTFFTIALLLLAIFISQMLHKHLDKTEKWN